MFFSDWRVLLRRWYAVLIGLVLSVGMCLAVSQVVSPSYQIKAMMVVLPPRTAVGTNGNPFLGLGGLGSVADVLSRSMMDGNTVQSLVKLGANDKYLVAQDVTSAGPVILVTSTGGTPADAVDTLRIVKEQLPDKLLKLQLATHVPENSLITLSQISQDEQPTIVRKSQIRAMFGVAALGLTLTLVLTGFLDGLLMRRRRQRSGEDPETVSTGPAGRSGLPPGESDGQYPRPAQHVEPAPRFAQRKAGPTPPTEPHILPLLGHSASPPSGYPVAASAHPVQPNGYPSQPNGHPAQPNGYPSQPNGHPAQPNGYPSQPNGHPAQPNGRPVNANARAAQATGRPNPASDYAEANGYATRPNGYPVQAHVRPVQPPETSPAEPSNGSVSQGSHAPGQRPGAAVFFDLDRLPAAFRDPSPAGDRTTAGTEPARPGSPAYEIEDHE
jgi:hypothetical protein